MALKIKTKDTEVTPTSIFDPTESVWGEEVGPLELVYHPDPILTEETIPFDFSNPQVDPVSLLERMKEVLVKERGMGLAAPQVGLPYRVFIMGVYDDPDGIIPVFNPVITTASDEEILMEEGCLSFPHLYMKVKRPAGIRVRYTTEKGITDTIKFDGLSARIFQHEYDHLHGNVFTKRANRIHRARGLKNQKLYFRREKRENA
jgi:peptide deformylase